MTIPKVDPSMYSNVHLWKLATIYKEDDGISSILYDDGIGVRDGKGSLIPEEILDFFLLSLLLELEEELFNSLLFPLQFRQQCKFQDNLCISSLIQRHYLLQSERQRNPQNPSFGTTKAHSFDACDTGGVKGASVCIQSTGISSTNHQKGQLSNAVPAMYIFPVDSACTRTLKCHKLIIYSVYIKYVIST